ncbi:FAD/NAD-P-binding domain-containing protein [Lentinus tigrinus ALCF2SS1-7]|uniref:FAD/NAD-P-binding domain-containing protein n=1 Tax=Lentinus tigrinus ALCF2SS1-7 TaxID=1328758 RepID=UPI0011663A15|nr:FAD/NAD-P-binding domain-containing protein [Lentinus tigrinus ALCF2SS1-7]
MPFESSSPSSSHQTTYPITFLVVGGAGLACALALRRVGHRVTVLERMERSAARGGNGVRVPPNLSKILFHWGLRDVLMSKASITTKLVFMRYESGELLGEHVWDAELLEETQGLFLMLSHSELYDVLYDTATKLGAEVHFNAEVVKVDVPGHSVVLSSGERLSGDVLIGADSEHGQCRTAVLGRRDLGTPTGLAVYDTLIPMAFVSEFDTKVSEESWQFAAFGRGKGVVAYRIRRSEEIALQLYAADVADGGCYEDGPSIDLPCITRDHEISEKLGRAVHGARRATRIPVRQYADLEDWVSDDGRLVLIGEAAHPFPPSTIQGTAMAVEDGAVLAKLFSHLSSEDQIDSFLYAFQEIRQSRVRDVREAELAGIFTITADGPEAAARDASMRAKAAKRINVLEGEGSTESAWEEYGVVFGYNCEDEADEWWVQWGRLRQRALEVHESEPSL